MSASSANYRVDSEKQDMSRDGSEVEPKQGIEDTEEQLEAQHVENNSLEKWNSPSINTYRYLAANFGFIIMGMNDAAYGVSQVASKIINRRLTFTRPGTYPVS